MHRLRNGIQNYDWGSVDAIPRFMGVPAGPEPAAELWIGTHPLKPSVAVVDDEEVPLREVVGDLPFMAKFLAAGRPLSLQVHPSRPQAEAGFAREDEAGIPRDAPHRVYRDPNHKPEMVLALTTFDSLIGFRPTAEVLRVLGPIDTPLAQRVAEDLRKDPGWAGIVRRIEWLLQSDVGSGDVAALLAACTALVDQGLDVKRAYQTAIEIAAHYPGDVGVVISLMLNRMTLQPGEAAYLETGVIHAHLSGMCLEVMASSDNVLRAGLTSKHIDARGLVECLNTGAARIARVTPDFVGPDTEIFSPTGADFALATTQVSFADPDGVPLVRADPAVLLCLGGEVTVINEQGRELALRRGESLLLQAEDGDARVHGLGEVAQVFAPTTSAMRSRLVDVV